MSITETNIEVRFLPVFECRFDEALCHIWKPSFNESLADLQETACRLQGIGLVLEGTTAALDVELLHSIVMHRIDVLSLPKNLH